LNGGTRGALGEVVDGRHNDDTARGLVDGESHQHGVGADHVSSPGEFALRKKLNEGL
jgi:hypothetical protein